MKYVIEGKLHKGNNRIFIETEKDKNGNPIGTFVDNVVNNIPEDTLVTIIIDYESK